MPALDSPEGSALKLAGRLLANRAHFEAELRLKLRRFPPSVVEETIQKLRGNGLLNDEAALRDFCRVHRGKKILSSSAMAFALATIGVQVEADRLPSPTVSELLKALQLMKFKKSGGEKERIRAGRWLARRGFGEDEIEASLQGYFGDTQRE